MNPLTTSNSKKMLRNAPRAATSTARSRVSPPARNRGLPGLLAISP